MQGPKRILLPITPAVPFGRVLRRAVWLARQCGAQLVLLHVGTEEIDASMPEDVTVTRLSLAGDALPQIMAVTASHDIDLIMMTPHEKWHSGEENDFWSFVRQSVIAGVMDAAHCPVWVDTGEEGAKMPSANCFVISICKSTAPQSWRRPAPSPAPWACRSPSPMPPSTPIFTPRAALRSRPQRGTNPLPGRRRKNSPACRAAPEPKPSL